MMKASEVVKIKSTLERFGIPDMIVDEDRVCGESDAGLFVAVYERDDDYRVHVFISGCRNIIDNSFKIESLDDLENHLAGLVGEIEECLSILKGSAPKSSGDRFKDLELRDRFKKNPNAPILKKCGPHHACGTHQGSVKVFRINPDEEVEKV